MSDPEYQQEAGAAMSARACREFADALMAEGFSDNAAIAIVAAWMSRSAGIDLAGYNAVIQNMVEAMVKADRER